MRRVRAKVKGGNGKEAICVGYFHRWAESYEEFESGPGNQTVALIEVHDGSIVEAYPHNITFLEPYSPKGEEGE